jgi:hypothetical protein
MKMHLPKIEVFQANMYITWLCAHWALGTATRTQTIEFEVYLDTLAANKSN